MSTDGGARMRLEPDSVHEDDDGHWLDCPRCGSPAYVAEILETGRCRGYQSDEGTDESVDRGVTCDATLALELVWDEE